MSYHDEQRSSVDISITEPLVGIFSEDFDDLDDLDDYDSFDDASFDDASFDDASFDDASFDDASFDDASFVGNSLTDDGFRTPSSSDLDPEFDHVSDPADLDLDPDLYEDPLDNLYPEDLDLLGPLAFDELVYEAEMNEVEAQLVQQNPHLQGGARSASSGAARQLANGERRRGNRFIDFILEAEQHRRAGRDRGRPDGAEGNMSAREGARMPMATRSGASRAQGPRDDLVDMEVWPLEDRRRDERQGNQPRNAATRTGASPRVDAGDEVIDLTLDDPESPVEVAAAPPARRASRNLRRQNSQALANPPAFARSDSSILGGGEGRREVIDLTEDDGPEPPRSRPAVPPRRPPRRAAEADLMFVEQRPRLPLPQPSPHHHIGRMPGALFPDWPRLRENIVDRLNIFDLLHRMPEEAGAFNPIGNVDLQYQQHAFPQRQPSPKPVHVPPPAARQGFTRDTDPDSAFVCPACNEELSYDPAHVSSSNAPPSRASKGRKRPRSEHHFWALKSCGHVYCEDCFDKRRPSAKNPNTGFRGDAKTPLCAVEGCETHVQNKGAWVGLYL